VATLTPFFQSESGVSQVQVIGAQKYAVRVPPWMR
jgi:multidrug efflux pump subunit AcrB